MVGVRVAGDGDMMRAMMGMGMGTLMGMVVEMVNMTVMAVIEVATMMGLEPMPSSMGMGMGMVTSIATEIVAIIHTITNYDDFDLHGFFIFIVRHFHTKISTSRDKDGEKM